MKVNNKCIIIPVAFSLLLTSCNVLEKASTHGLKSGYYKLDSKQKNAQKVYLDVTDEKIDAYHQINNRPDEKVFLSIPLKSADSLILEPLVFKKQSLDIDITAILLKYRPSVYGLQPQMTTDFNIALYAGWRFDNYHIKRGRDPLGKSYQKIVSRGYDFGVFAGPGSTLISPFTTQNNRTDEYSGMIFQTGVAGFLESNIASFGVAVGIDYLLNPDREVWIYRNKPWVGFIIGIALN